MRIVADTESDLKRAIAMLIAAGFKLSLGPNPMWWAELRPDITPPPAPVPWWLSLKAGDIVRTIRDGVVVRHAPTDSGAIWKTIGLTWGDMHIVSNPDGTAWALPIPGTDDAWLQVNPAPVPLFVKSSDVRRK